MCQLNYMLCNSLEVFMQLLLSSLSSVKRKVGLHSKDPFNKKVLLRERKRNITRCVASTFCCHNRGGVPHPRTGGTPPRKDMGPVKVLCNGDGVPPRKDMGPVEVLWDGDGDFTCMARQIKHIFVY